MKIVIKLPAAAAAAAAAAGVAVAVRSFAAVVVERCVAGRNAVESSAMNNECVCVWIPSYA